MKEDALLRAGDAAGQAGNPDFSLVPGLERPGAGVPPRLLADVVVLDAEEVRVDRQAHDPAGTRRSTSARTWLRPWTLGTMTMSATGPGVVGDAPPSRTRGSPAAVESTTTRMRLAGAQTGGDRCGGQRVTADRQRLADGHRAAAGRRLAPPPWPPGHPEAHDRDRIMASSRKSAGSASTLAPVSWSGRHRIPAPGWPGPRGHVGGGTRPLGGRIPTSSADKGRPTGTATTRWFSESAGMTAPARPEPEKLAGMHRIPSTRPAGADA